MLSQHASIALSIVALVPAWLVYKIFISPRRSALYNLPGPASDSMIWGNFWREFKSRSGEYTQEIISKHNCTSYRYFGFLQAVKFSSVDPVVMNHVLANSYIYPKHPETRAFLAGLCGEGLLTAEGDVHKRQRRIMLPSFSASNLKPHMSIFLEKAFQLRDKLVEISQAAASAKGNEEKGTGETKGAEVEVMAWLGRATMDIIGLAGFNYDFNSLQDDNNELSNAFRTMFNSLGKFSIVNVLQWLLPYFLQPLVRTDETRKTEHCLSVMRSYSQKIVADKKALILAESNEKDGINKNAIVERDTLSLLLRANMAKDLPNSQRLSDQEVQAQIQTFMLAGFETSSTALTWMLKVLADRPDVQEKLRQELNKLEAEPSVEELNACAYLEAFVREGLRLFPPVASTGRVSLQDDLIPLSEPIPGRDGKLIEHIAIPKGTFILIPAIVINKSKEMFGKDASEFKPERWLPSAEKPVSNPLEVPWGNQMTFIAGPRACIGYRFALLEIKTILFALVRSLAFSHVSSALKFEAKQTLVMRPNIVGREKEGSQMPLMIREVALL